MIWGDPRTVATKRIVGPGDVKARQKTLGVINLAGDIEELGGRPIHPIVVKKVRVGWQIIAGRDRYAALLLAGIKSTPVSVVESATEQELHNLEVSENLHRRVDNRDEMIAERVRKVAERVVRERASSDTNVSKPGRPKTAESEARERVAAQLGTTSGAVKEAVRREKVREEGAVGRMPTDASGTHSEGCTRPGPPPPPIDLHGHPMPPQLLDVAGLVKQFAKLEAAARAALEEANNLGLFASMSPDTVQLLTGVFEAALAASRAGKPTDLCPRCKGTEGVKCKTCHEARWVTAQVYADATAEKGGWTAEEQAAGLAADPLEAPACAHAYRDGGVSTGLCLHCGAEGAATWTDSCAMPVGKCPPTSTSENAGWKEANGPGSDRAAYVAPPKKKPGGRRVVFVNADGTETEVTE